MTNLVLDDYSINVHTMALLPAFHTDYQTIAIETHRTYYVKQTIMKILKEACLDGGASYDGRRDTVTHYAVAKQKIPIPINPARNIYAFPTHSPTHMQCSWIFYNHVKTIIANILDDYAEPTSNIHFKNGQTITVPISDYVLTKQMQRTAMCQHHYAILLGDRVFDHRIPIQPEYTY